jgi:hypothetical protein
MGPAHVFDLTLAEDAPLSTLGIDVISAATIANADGV